VHLSIGATPGDKLIGDRSDGLVACGIPGERRGRRAK
jgi:hypothetical protein